MVDKPTDEQYAAAVELLRRHRAGEEAMTAACRRGAAAADRSRAETAASQEAYLVAEKLRDALPFFSAVTAARDVVANYVAASPETAVKTETSCDHLKAMLTEAGLFHDVEVKETGHTDVAIYQNGKRRWHFSFLPDGRLNTIFAF